MAEWENVDMSSIPRELRVKNNSRSAAFLTVACNQIMRESVISWLTFTYMLPSRGMSHHSGFLYCSIACSDV